MHVQNYGDFGFDRIGCKWRCFDKLNLTLIRKEMKKSKRDLFALKALKNLEIFRKLRHVAVDQTW